MVLSWVFSNRTIGQQCAALPLQRDASGAVQVGLITSRGTGRWVLPKGWLKTGKSASQAAEEEAREEAGLIGQIGATAIGTYTYRKRLHLLASVACEVHVYPLRVTGQLPDWPEKGERHIRFMPPWDAAKLVDEPELAKLLLSGLPELNC